MSRLDDADFVREQYADEANLAARKSVYADSEGPDAREVLFEAVAEAEPRRVLEVGGGEGELAERIVRELGAELVGIDQSERMVELQRAKGIDARVGDAAALAFADGEFDLVIAAWVLYHVPDLDRALAEFARVLEPGGRLIAVTNSASHLQELFAHVGRERQGDVSTFRREGGVERLRPHFARIEQRDVDGWVTFDENAVRRYVASWPALGDPDALPPLPQPLRVRRATTIFVAEKAA